MVLHTLSFLTEVIQGDPVQALKLALLVGNGFKKEPGAIVVEQLLSVIGAGGAVGSAAHFTKQRFQVIIGSG
jgi:hypothetical protein